MADELPMMGLMSASEQAQADSQPAELPVDFFELEYLSYKPHPDQRNRELPEIEHDAEPGELPVDFFELEFLSYKPHPEQRNRELPNIDRG